MHDTMTNREFLLLLHQKLLVYGEAPHNSVMTELRSMIYSSAIYESTKTVRDFKYHKEFVSRAKQDILRQTVIAEVIR